MDGEKQSKSAKKTNRIVGSDGLHVRRGIWHYWLKIDGRWRERSAHTTNYQEARRRRHDALEAQKKGRLPAADKGKLPFEKAAEAWMAARQNQTLAPNTRRIERERLPQLLARFSGRRLNSFTIEDIKGYQAARKASPRTINLEIDLLRGILKNARCWTPLAEDYKPLRRSKQGPGIALTHEEERRLFETARRKPGWEIAYFAGLLAANSTLRGCEVKGLRLGNIDLFNRSITVRRDATKTDAGVRCIPLNEAALWATAQLLERAGLLGATDAEHYLLPAFLYRRTKQAAPVGGTGHDPTQPMKTWRTAWRSLRKAAGLPTLRFHDLRHTCITKLAEAGVPDHVLMSISGHISPEMIKHYSHIRSKAKEAAIAAMHSYSPREASADEGRPAKLVV